MGLSYWLLNRALAARPWGVLLAASTPVLSPRAWGNLVKTRQRILTISLLRRGARLFDRRVLRSGRTGPTSRGRAKLHFAAAASTPTLSARLARFIYIRLTAEIAESLL